MNSKLTGEGRVDAELVSHTADDNLVGYPFVVQSVPFVG